MIPHKQTRNITIGGIDNSVQFSIATSGKAFRALIDTVYSDKILAPVRELITNAADAHVAGGNPNPFKVIVPTNLDPTFGVRDFGTGMDHDTITDLYTTLFASSKDGSNDETGMLGLGSKSPFAYTDSFTVEAFDGVSKRVYMAYTEEEIPSLSLVGTTPSDEHRGICVKFPVQTHHRGAFVDAIYKVIRGLDVVPELDGVELVQDLLFKVVRQGDTWKLVKGSESSPHMLRQGGVLYPLEARLTREVGIPDRRYYDNVHFVFDAPIGTADVTLSRESLSYDKQTEENLREILTAAWDDVQAQVLAEYEACTSQYEHMQWLSKVPEFIREARVFTGYDSVVMRGYYDLHPSHFKKARNWTQDEMAAVKKDNSLFPVSVKKHETITQIHAVDVPNLRIVLDDGVTPRRRSRMLSWADKGSSRSRILIPAGPNQDKVVKRLKALMHLTDDQFVNVADTYDEGPRSVTRAATPKRDELKEKLDNGAIWVERYRYDAIVRGVGNIPTLQYKMSDLAYQFRGQDQFADLVTLTPKQVETLQPNPDNSLSAFLWKEASKHADEVFSSRHEWRLRSALGDAGCSHPKAVAEHLGFKDSRLGPENVVGRSLTWQYVSFIVNTRTAPIEARLVGQAQERYPALFPQPLDEAAARDYLQQQDNNPNTTNTTQEATS